MRTISKKPVVSSAKAFIISSLLGESHKIVLSQIESLMNLAASLANSTKLLVTSFPLAMAIGMYFFKKASTLVLATPSFSATL